MRFILVTLALSVSTAAFGGEIVFSGKAESQPSNPRQQPAVKRGEAFEKCLIEESNTALNRIEQSGAKINRGMIVPVAKDAFQKCIPFALSETLSLQEVQEIRLHVLEYLDSYWINSRGT